MNDTPNPLNMDGHLRDWPDCRMITLDQSDQVVEGKAFWKGADDFSGRIFLTYDTEYLYISAVVTRNGHPVNANDPSSLWNGDCLELFLSTNSNPAAHGRLTRFDYHIGISPGTNCSNAQVWCFNQGRSVLGARIKAKNSNKGYILEVALPLDFFSGLTIASHQTCGFDVALDEGGTVSGNRLVQMDASDHANSWQNPSDWGRIEWIGTTQVSIPDQVVPDQNAMLVADGTKDAVFLGVKTVTGIVLNEKRVPLSGARVSTWPSTLGVVTDSSGKFVLPNIKVYRETVVYARQDGYFTSLGTLNLKTRTATIHLSGMPVSVLDSNHPTTPIFFGADIQSIPQAEAVQDSARDLGLNLLCLKGKCLEALAPDAQTKALDGFLTLARSLGALPEVEVPLGPDATVRGVAWLRASEGIPGNGIRYWSLGDEPDRSTTLSSPSGGDYNAYDYINDFREFYNAMKSVNPALVIQGPNLAFPSDRGAANWLKPFLRFDGDIVNLVSVHHYAALSPGQASPEALEDDIRKLSGLYQTLQSRVSQDTDIYIPLVFSKIGLYPESNSKSGSVSSAGPNFTTALWKADVIGTMLQQGAWAGSFGDLESLDENGFLKSSDLNPLAWVLKIFAKRWKGIPVTAQVLKPLVHIYASQDPRTQDVSLFILNESPQYYWFNISLNGQGHDLVVDAGLDRHFRFEVPNQGLASLRIKADGSVGDEEVYTSKMAKAGQAPLVQPLKP
ncbi:MAG: sugar-binding protein [bacterium]